MLILVGGTACCCRRPSLTAATKITTRIVQPVSLCKEVYANDFYNGEDKDESLKSAVNIKSVS